MTEVIKQAIEDSGIVYDNDGHEDCFRSCEFRDEDGLAEAVVTFDTCVSPGQTQLIRESDIWEMGYISPKGEQSVDVQLVEVESGAL